MSLTQERAKELFEYEPESGAFTRKTTGYVFTGLTVRIDSKTYDISRVIWLLYYGVWPSLIDHKNRCRADTSITNLREATVQQNAYNQTRYNPNGVKGVYNCGRPSKPWQAQIRIEGQKVNLGRFVTIEEAAEAYRQAALKYHGEFACLK